MTQFIVYSIEIVVVLGFFGALLYRTSPENCGSLKKSRRDGCLSGGCLLPILVFVAVVLTAESAGDMGGPLFWPLFAALGAALGFAVATLYFILFKREGK